MNTGDNMRIIAGSLRGRQIKALSGDNTRPTSDKIKENIFNMLGQFFDHGQALDLFAGSGNLGFEAISRGMEKAVLIDINPAAIRIIKDNVNILKLTDQVTVYRNDAFRALTILAKNAEQFDLIFLDPPYGKIKITDLLTQIIAGDLLAEAGFVMCEFDAGQLVSYDQQQLEVVRRETYGMIEILILQKKVAV